MAESAPEPTAESAAGQPAPGPAKPKRECLPTKLTPKMQKAIRLVASGHTRVEAAKEIGLRADYLEKVLRTPLGRAEFERMQAMLERVVVEKMASAEAGVAAPGMTEAAAEVELAVIEAIRKMRNVMNTSRSDMAVVNAAKQILELAQASKRMAAAQAPQEEGVQLSNEDQTFLAAAIGDLRTINAFGAPGASDNDDDEDSESDEATQAVEANPAPVSAAAPEPWNEEKAREVVEGGLPASPESRQE